MIATDLQGLLVNRHGSKYEKTGVCGAADDTIMIAYRKIFHLGVADRNRTCDLLRRDSAHRAQCERQAIKTARPMY